MPIDISELTTRAGHPVLKAIFAGDVTVADAQRYHSQLLPGQRYEFVGHLIVGKVSGVSADVKRVLSSAKADPNNPPPVAIVLSSAIARMVAGLVMRTGNNENTDFFATEADALEWLDQRVAAYLSKAGKLPPTSPA
jgi:hypothetical protein